MRRATGRDDIWGVGLAMSAEAVTPRIEFDQFVQAYDANYVTRMASWSSTTPRSDKGSSEPSTATRRSSGKGCTPPDLVDWDDNDNNKAFLTQRVVMTPNETLSIPNALKHERPEDYYKNTTTIEWPLGPTGEPFPSERQRFRCRGLQGAATSPTAKEFVRFLVERGLA